MSVRAWAVCLKDATVIDTVAKTRRSAISKWSKHAGWVNPITPEMTDEEVDILWNENRGSFELCVVNMTRL